MPELAATSPASSTPHSLAAPVDLRSDTVTKPTAAMRAAMASAEVGDDVYGEDPTVNRLQSRAAEIFEREAALFVPTGSMGNLIAIKLQAAPGTEVICDVRGHINQYEMAAMSAVAGALPRTADAPDGILNWKTVESLIRPKIYYVSQTSLVALENTHNMAGGSVYPQHLADEICDGAHAAGLKVHLDGARIFNAAVALDRPAARVADLTRKFDSVMFCLSKGLGAPVGSMLLGSREFIDRARAARKLLGGGMRQAGVLAAAGLIALEDSPSLLRRDHENARYLAEGLAKIPGISLDPKKVVTNIIIFDVKNTGRTAADLSAALKSRGILSNPTGPYLIRMVTHFDVDRPALDAALSSLRSLLLP